MDEVRLTLPQAINIETASIEGRNRQEQASAGVVGYFGNNTKPIIPREKATHEKQ